MTETGFHLHAQVGGEGDSFEVALTDTGELRYRHMPMPTDSARADSDTLERVTIVRPHPAHWQRFWAALETAEIWEWEERYELGRYEVARYGGLAEDRLPRRGWFVELSDGDRQLHASGTQSYPATWREFCRALSALVGQRAFD